MARPSSLPDWGGLANLTIPSGAKRLLGWILKESPPSSFVNWFWNLITLWVVYLDAKTNGTFELRISPKIATPMSPVAAGGALSSAGWFSTALTWAVGSNTNVIASNSGFALHVLEHRGIAAMLANRMFSGDKVQLTEVEAVIDKTGAGTFSMTLSESPEDGSAGSTSLMVLTFTGTTTGFETKAFNNGGTPVDVDLSKFQLGTLVANPSAGTIEIAAVVLKFQVVP